MATKRAAEAAARRAVAYYGAESFSDLDVLNVHRHRSIEWSFLMWPKETRGEAWRCVVLPDGTYEVGDRYSTGP